MIQKKAIFLDRDGTINEEVGYLQKIEQLSLFPITWQAIKLINESGMLAVVITNQSGVARGYFDESFVETVHQTINENLQKKGCFIDKFYYCPHHPNEGKGRYHQVCSCRKPKAGMFFTAARENNIDLSQSYMIGDTIKDMEAAKNASIKGILVRTGYGGNISADTTGILYIAQNILDAVTWILKEQSR